jgi:hypothetical protein
MLRTMTLALVLQSCAHAVAPASSPASASTMAVDFDCLDLQGQKELLAGIELEAGEQAAKLARCNVQRGAAVKFGDAQAQRAEKAEGRLLWALPVTGIGAAILGAVIGAAVEAATHKQPAVAR